MKSLSHANSVECGVLQDSRLGPLLFSDLTNDHPQTLKKACVSMYTDNSRVYTSAATVKYMIDTLNIELQLVLQWVTSNRLVLNISKMKIQILGTNHSLNVKPYLHLLLNDVAIEQVEVSRSDLSSLVMSLFSMVRA
jgi:hypothetical protein